MKRYRVSANLADGRSVAIAELQASTRKAAERLGRRYFGGWPGLRIQATPAAHPC